MKSEPSRPSSFFRSAANHAAIEEQAAAWLVQRQGGLTAEDEVRFQTWLASDERCGSVLAELEEAWTTLSYPARTGESEVARQQLAARRRGQRRGRVALASLGLAAAAAVMIALWLPRWSPVDAGSAEAVVAVRPDKQFLPDGSVIQRNARTDLEIAYSDTERRVRLTRGEALFTVAHDPGRPFFVVIGGIEVRAVGTEFSVRYEAEQVNVLVTQGRVAVSQRAAELPPASAETPAPSLEPSAVNSDATLPEALSTSSREPVYVDAGRQVVMPVHLPPAVVPQINLLAEEEISAALAWRGKRIEFIRTPLSQVVELFNRENRLQLSIHDAATGELRITGLLWADDPEGLVRLLETGFEVVAERAGDFIYLRQSQ